jgi:lipopolysaccharide transport system ATP-binding protein
MYVRLAFSVAAHLEPEILIVDEVLAVGDAAFQERCLGKMKEVAAQDGRTVVFVSHNIASIAGLCTKGLVLEKGRTRYLGPVRAAVDDYMSDATSGRFESDPDSRACIRAAEIDATALAVGDLRIHVEVESPKVIRPSVGVVVSSYSGGTLFGTDAKTHPMEAGVARCKRTRMTLEVPKLPLHSGRYIVSLFLTDLDMGPVEHQRDALSFEFVSPVFIPNLPPPEMIGPLLLPARWSQEVGEA